MASQSPEKEKKPKKEGGAAKAEGKAKAGKGEQAAEAKPAKAPEAPRPPADPRLKILKKFRGRFLPKGELRDRLKALMTRWDSGEDHGGVTLEELKALLTDWRASRAKKPRPAAKA